jgi:hypothetical protein
MTFGNQKRFDRNLDFLQKHQLSEHCQTIEWQGTGLDIEIMRRWKI